MPTVSATPIASTTLATSAPYVSYQAETPTEADHLADAVGVDTHFSYTGTPYVDEYPQISSLLIASGIRHIRDGGIPDDATFAAKLTMLGQAGIKHSVGFGLPIKTSDVQYTLAKQAPYIEFVEAGNEVDSSGDPNWAADVKASQQVLYDAVKSSPQGAGVTVLGPALADPDHYAALGNIDAMSDAGNLHNAQCNLNPGAASPAYLSIAHNQQLVGTSTTHAVWTTETGYNSDLSASCAIPDSLTAKYDPRTVAERFLNGEPRIYFYQFANMPTDPMFGNMGLVDASANPKPQYTALKSMIGMVSDRGGEFTTTPLNYQLSGATQNVHHLLLQKRDGTYILMLWLEVAAWQSISADNVGGMPIAVTPQNVTVSTSKTYLTTTQFAYDPTSWQLVPAKVTVASNSYSVSISDSISFIEFK